MDDSARLQFMQDFQQRLLDAAASGRTLHQETWSIGQTGDSSAMYTVTDPWGVDAAGAVQLAESLGWTLMNVGYVHVPTRHQSSILTDSANLYGRIVGIHLFRRAA